MTQMSWFEEYTKRVECARVRTASGFIELKSSCLRPVCRKHAMLIFQRMFTKKISPFFLSSDFFVDLLGKSVKFWPVVIEDMPWIHEDIIYLRIAHIRTFDEFRICSANTIFFDKITIEIYEKYYNCIWCHRTWLSLGVSFSLKNISADSVDVKDIKRFDPIVEHSPKYLNERQKIRLLKTGMDMFSANTVSDVRRSYNKFITGLWELAKADDKDTLSSFHNHLCEIQSKILRNNIYSN